MSSGELAKEDIDKYSELLRECGLDEKLHSTFLFEQMAEIDEMMQQNGKNLDAETLKNAFRIEEDSITYVPSFTKYNKEDIRYFEWKSYLNEDGKLCDEKIGYYGDSGRYFLTGYNEIDSSIFSYEKYFRNDVLQSSKNAQISLCKKLYSGEITLEEYEKEMNVGGILAGNVNEKDYFTHADIYIYSIDNGKVFKNDKKYTFNFDGEQNLNFYELAKEKDAQVQQDVVQETQVQQEAAEETQVQQEVAQETQVQQEAAQETPNEVDKPFLKTFLMSAYNAGLITTNKLEQARNTLEQVNNIINTTLGKIKLTNNKEQEEVDRDADTER